MCCFLFISVLQPVVASVFIMEFCVTRILQKPFPVRIYCDSKTNLPAS